jgi:SPP1 gp7 family putative phage head morphogenesis protein
MVFEQTRLLNLAGQIQDQINSFASAAAIGISEEDTALVRKAMEDAQRQIREGLIDPPPGFSFEPRLPTMQVLELGRMMGDDEPLGKLIRSAAPLTADLVQQSLVGGLVAGLGPSQVARNMAAAGELPLQRANLIARTEMLRIYRTTTLATYAANSEVVEGWMWMSALDRRTCPTCWAMHGTKHKLNEKMDTHPACRCTMVPLTKPWSKLGYKDHETNHPRYEIALGAVQLATVAYAIQKEVLGPMRHKLWVEGAIELPHMVQRTHHPVWGGGLRLRNIEETLVAAQNNDIGFFSLEEFALLEKLMSELRPALREELAKAG